MKCYCYKRDVNHYVGLYRRSKFKKLNLKRMRNPSLICFHKIKLLVEVLEIFHLLHLKDL